MTHNKPYRIEMLWVRRLMSSLMIIKLIIIGLKSAVKMRLFMIVIGHTIC